MNKIKEGNDDLFWVKCPYCGNNYIPNLKIIFGSENNKNNKLTTTTAIVDNVLLFSAKTLNYNRVKAIFSQQSSYKYLTHKQKFDLYRDFLKNNSN